EGPHQAALDALLRRQMRDVGIAEPDAAGIRTQHAGHQIDQRGLAGAVRADQRVALALREGDRDVARDDERAEGLLETAGRPRRDDHGAPRRDGISRASPPRMPFCRNITTITSSRPIQKYQYCGLMPENWSRATRKMMV